MKNIKALIFWLMIIGWTVLMFSLSGQTAAESEKLSRGLTQYLMQFSFFENMPADVFEHFLRKAAHFCMFFLEGALLYLSLYFTTRSGRDAFTFAGTASICIAGINEFHQLFFVGRSCELGDVAINSAGAVSGILAAMLVYHCYLLIKYRRDA